MKCGGPQFVAPARCALAGSGRRGVVSHRPLSRTRALAGGVRSAAGPERGRRGTAGRGTGAGRLRESVLLRRCSGEAVPATLLAARLLGQRLAQVARAQRAERLSPSLPVAVERVDTPFRPVGELGLVVGVELVDLLLQARVLRRTGSVSTVTAFCWISRPSSTGGAPAPSKRRPATCRRRRSSGRRRSRRSGRPGLPRCRRLVSEVFARLIFLIWAAASSQTFLAQSSGFLPVSLAAADSASERGSAGQRGRKPSSPSPDRSLPWLTAPEHTRPGSGPRDITTILASFVRYPSHLHKRHVPAVASICPLQSGGPAPARVTSDGQCADARPPPMLTDVTCHDVVRPPPWSRFRSGPATVACRLRRRRRSAPLGDVDRDDDDRDRDHRHDDPDAPRWRPRRS